MNKIAIDFDDVICAFWHRVIECFNLEFGADVPYGSQNDWGDNPLKNAFPTGGYIDWWDWWRDREKLWGGCDAVPGALGGLAELSAQGYYLEILTHTPPWARRHKAYWLWDWNPVYDQLTFVPSGEPKHDVSDATLLIDDRTKNVQGWIETSRPAILFTQPWNKTRSFVDAPLLVQRAFDWHDVLDLAPIAMGDVA